MAVPSSFDESNAVLSKPDDDNTDCECLSVCKTIQANTGLPVIVSCWKLTTEELEEVKRTGRIWLVVAGETAAPCSVHGIKPFVEINT